jgi:hypothetical protein
MKNEIKIKDLLQKFIMSLEKIDSAIKRKNNLT